MTDEKKNKARVWLLVEVNRNPEREYDPHWEPTPRAVAGEVQDILASFDKVATTGGRYPDLAYTYGMVQVWSPDTPETHESMTSGGSLTDMTEPLVKRNLTEIRRELTRFVEGKMANQGVDYVDDVDLLEAPRCPLVNPLCPDDLCVLPAGHPGSEDEIHVLGTDPYNHATRYEGFPLVEVGTSDAELIRLGWEAQRRDARGRD